MGSPMSNGYRAESRGLYDPGFEHDACGVGFCAQIDNRKSHEIVRMGLRVLANLTHRGAVGADPLAGDGAGIGGAESAALRGEIAAFGAALRLGKLTEAERDRQANRAQNDTARRKQIQSEPIRVSNVSSLKIGENQYRVRFSVRNYDDEPREIHAGVDWIGIKSFTVPGNYTMDGIEIISGYPAKSLNVHSDSYSTSHLLSW